MIDERAEKMKALLKKCGHWWKEGEIIVMDKQSDCNEVGVVEFVHSDDMISVKFGERHELVFHEQIRRAIDIEIRANKRMFRDMPATHCTNGHSEWDD